MNNDVFAAPTLQQNPNRSEGNAEMLAVGHFADASALDLVYLAGGPTAHGAEKLSSTATPRTA